MSNHQDMINIIKEFTGQKNVITVPRALIQLTGDLNQAVIISQCVFWSDKTSRADGWFYKSAKDWAEETSLTERQVRYAINKLEAAGFIETVVRRANGTPTLHYQIRFDKIVNSILQNCQMEMTKLSNGNDTVVKSLTETTTETTTHIKDDDGDEFFKICEAYQDLTGFIPEMIKTEIRKALTIYTPQAIIDAVGLAAKNNVRKWIYIEAILKNRKSKEDAALAGYTHEPIAAGPELSKKENYRKAAEKFFREQRSIAEDSGWFSSNPHLPGAYDARMGVADVYCVEKPVVYEYGDIVFDGEKWELDEGESLIAWREPIAEAV